MNPARLYPENPSARPRRRGISGRIEPGDKRAAVNLNLKLLSLIPGGSAPRVVLAGDSEERQRSL